MKASLRYLMPLLLLSLTACESTYYNAWEKVGVHKRDILVDRIEDAQDAQEDTQEQFADALEQYRSVVEFDGGDLDKQYKKFNAEFEASELAAADIAERVDAIEDVAEDLFEEWQEELALYQNASLRRSSEQQLRSTKTKYRQLIGAMRRAEQSTAPVLNRFRDQVLFLKHNLNARAIASLRGELGTVDQDVQSLIKAMEQSIAEADAFIRDIQSS